MPACPTHALLSRPRPAYAPGLPLGRLATPELLLVTLLRLWIAEALEPGEGAPRWTGGARAAGLGAGAVTSFDAFWRLMAATPRRAGSPPLDLRCPCDPALGVDEGWFLQALRALQRGEETAAGAILAGWMPPSGARLALAPLADLAEALLRVGLALPDRGRASAPG